MPFPDEVSWVQEFMATQGREPTLADYVARKESERQVSETGQPVDQMWFDQFAERPEYQSLQDVQFLTQPGGFPGSGSGVPDPWARSESDPGDQMQRWAAMLGQVRGGATGEDVRQQYGNTEGPISESWLIENMNQLAQSNRPWEYNFPEQNRQAAVNLEPEPEPGEPFWHARVRQIEEWINSNMPEEMPKKERAIAGPPIPAGANVPATRGSAASSQGSLNAPVKAGATAVEQSAQSGQAIPTRSFPYGRGAPGQSPPPEPGAPLTIGLPQQSPPPDFYASQTTAQPPVQRFPTAAELYSPTRPVSYQQAPSDRERARADLEAFLGDLIARGVNMPNSQRELQAEIEQWRARRVVTPPGRELQAEIEQWRARGARPTIATFPSGPAGRY